jgi:hypothetical protein
LQGINYTAGSVKKLDNIKAYADAKDTMIQQSPGIIRLILILRCYNMIRAYGSFAMCGYAFLDGLKSILKK